MQLRKPKSKPERKPRRPRRKPNTKPNAKPGKKPNAKLTPRLPLPGLANVLEPMTPPQKDRPLQTNPQHRPEGVVATTGTGNDHQGRIQLPKPKPTPRQNPRNGPPDAANNAPGTMETAGEAKNKRQSLTEMH